PYAYLYRYLGAWNNNLAIEDATTATATIEAQFVDTIGLPVQQSVRFISGGTWSARFTDTNSPLGTYGLSALSGSEDRFAIVAGNYPAEMDAEGRIPLLLPETMLFANGIQVGDTLTLQRQGGEAVEAYVAALWRPRDESDPLWIFPPRFFEQEMLIPEETLMTLIADIETPIDELAWFLVFDGSDVRTSEIDALLSASTSGQRAVDLALPGIRLSDSPDAGLQAFNVEVDALIQQLFIIILPVGGLVLYFISLVAGLLVTRQQAEDVKLRSRGMSQTHVMTIHVLMWSFIVGTALSLSLFLSPLLVKLIGQTASFLDFTGTSSVNEVVITTEALTIAIGAGVIASSSGLLLAWRITQQNINSLKRVDKISSKAWWQRAYLDFIVIGLSAYALYTLFTQDGIDVAESPFANPLAFVAPTLFALGLTLLFLRLLPIVLTILARLIGISSNIPLLMALRELTRNVGRYRGTLIMTAFTLSLVGFTASMASTLDRSLLDVVRYQVGAELVVVTVPDAQTEQSQEEATGETSEEVTGFNAPPVLQLLELEAVDFISRVGLYDARLSVTGRRLTGLAIGIDREGLGAVTFMRDDFADVPLGNMLNELANNRTGIIISQHTADEYGIAIGQEIRYEVQALGEWQTEIRATVVGYIEYFPTIDPSNYEFFLLTSIQSIFEISGTPLPFNVWLNLNDNATVADAQNAIAEIDFPVLRYREPQALLEEAQAEPSRRGVLGFLSVGFIASIVLTLIGAVIQSTASFSAQSSQLGSLRAMGMSGFSVRLYILILQGLIAISGVGSGTLIGIGTTLLFLPFLDFSGGLPPYIVRVAWNEIALVYIIFGAILLLVALFLSVILSRQQLSRVVKLGNI
ncbi:MAG: ABC transporter permease, partial [Phototrophicaceae bacterium]